MLPATQTVSGVFCPLQTRLSAAARLAGNEPHSKHTPALLCGNEPAGQEGKQAEAPAAEKVPAGHCEHETFPPGAKVPALHCAGPSAQRTPSPRVEEVKEMPT